MGMHGSARDVVFHILAAVLLLLLLFQITDPYWHDNTVRIPTSAVTSPLTSSEPSGDNSHGHGELFVANPTLVTREEAGDIDLSGSSTRTLDGDVIIGNVTLTGEAVLYIDNAHVDICGTITISSEAMLRITNSEVCILSPDLTRDTSLINITGSGKLVIGSSTVTIEPYPFDPLTLDDPDSWLSEHGSYTPFIFTDEHAEVIIADGTNFTVFLPSKVVPEYLKDQQYVTAGTILLAGRSSWSVSDSDLNGYLYTYLDRQNVSHASRWFWLSMQGESHFTLKDSAAELRRCTPDRKTIFKPTQGSMELLGSSVVGEVLVETVSEMTIANTSFDIPDIPGITDELDYPIKINDHTVSTLADSIVKGHMEIGWSSAVYGYGKASPHVDLTRCNIYGNISVCTSASISIVDTDVSGGITISDNVSMAVDSSRLSCLDIWMGHHKVLWEMAENVKISLEDSELENLRVLPKTSPPYPESIIEAARELPLNVTLTLEGSRLKKLNLSANSSLLLNLFNGSRINDFISPELGVYEATVINASIPRVDSKDVTIHVLKRLDFSLELNERPLADGRIVLYYDDEEVMNLTTGEDGNVSAFVYFQRTDNSSTVTWDHYYRVELDYLNFRKSRNILLEETQWYYRIEHNWEDRIGPQITEIGHAPRSWNAMKSVFVRATVTDGEVAVIRNVTVMYSVDGGSWRSVEMMSKGDSRYECSLPGQWFGKEVEYYVVAYDGIGNSNVSPTRSFQVGGEHLRLCLLSIIALFVAIVAIMGLKHWRRRKIMRYAKRRAGR